ncbi:MAG: hypothetical protein H7Z18_04280, partial [Methylophilaceae bacterium]|nr:hypothetical protein [Methylophilaceae bacterium]
MKLDAQDWRKLQNPLISLGLTLLVVGISCWFTNDYVHKKALDLQAQTMQFSQAR